MSDNQHDIDVDSDEFLDAPKALRDAYKRLSSQVRDITSERDTLRTQVTATALNDVLKEFKNPERVKRDLLADKIDPLNSEAVSRWMESNGDDYARGSAAPAPSAPSVPDEEVAAHQRLQSSSGLQDPADMSKWESVETQITKDMTGPELLELYRKAGI